jgi:hypothetical protein
MLSCGLQIAKEKSMTAKRGLKYIFLNRLAFSGIAALTLLAGSTARLTAGPITINFVTAPGFDGKLTYITNPAGAQPAQDSFLASLVSPQYGTGTLSLPSDFINYGTATEHADVANFVFGAGTFSGSEDGLINFATGAVTLTYHITSGTGVFSGAVGTLTESAQFTSFGSFSPNVPATEAITSGGGTLTVTPAVAPEPGTVVIVALGLGLLLSRSPGRSRTIAADRSKELPI